MTRLERINQLMAEAQSKMQDAMKECGKDFDKGEMLVFNTLERADTYTKMLVELHKTIEAVVTLSEMSYLVVEDWRRNQP